MFSVALSVASPRLAAFHGPLVAAELAAGLAPGEAASLLGALAGRYPAALPFGAWLRPPPPPKTAVAGPLLGGCLSLLAATIGTPFFPDLAGSVLFWEEINEPAYRVDRMLTHLRLSDTLTGIEAMIVGHLDGGDSANGSANGANGGESATDWPAVVGDSLSGLPWPLAWGLASGHRRPNATLPLGLTARLAAGGPDDRQLWLEAP